VDDEPIGREILAENLAVEGYVVVEADSGEAAWQLIDATPERFEAILLDRMMPDMDGIEILRRVKQRADMRHVPVIMQTGMTADADVLEGLQAGAYYYLTKPFSADTLLANVAPEPGRVVLGLSELMLNAVEHGNLAIGYREKSQLIESDRLHDEIGRRLSDPRYASRQAEVLVRRENGTLRFTIRDQGQGFDWRGYLDMSPERAFDTHGRGIAMSRMISFDSLEYRGCGNEVEAAIRLS